MTDFLDFILVANAGVLVEGAGIGLLVDGMHHEDGHAFSKVPTAVLADMRRGAAPFADLQYLLFTHEHPDHFTPRHVLEYVRERPVRGIFLPDRACGSPNLGLLLTQLARLGVPHQPLGLEPGRWRRFELGHELALTVIGTRHMGPQFQAVRNDSFLLSLGGMNVLFTGDGDHVAAYYAGALAGVSLDAAFVNPIFFHNPAGQAIINEIFRPRHVVIYHMPFKRDDTLRFAYMVGRDTEKFANPALPVHVLSEEGQTLRLHAAGR